MPDDWQRPDILYLAPVMNEIDLESWIKNTSAKFTGLGIQGFLRREGDADCGMIGAKRVEANPWYPNVDILRGIDAVFVSENDLTGQASLLEILIEQVPIVLVTKGKNGADLYHHSQSFHVGVHLASEVDPTGAGDCFAAGFLFALAMNKSPADAAKFAAACASLIIEGKAAQTFSRFNEVDSRARRIEITPNRHQDSNS